MNQALKFLAYVSMINRIKAAFRKAWQQSRPVFDGQPLGVCGPAEHQFNYRRIWKTAVFIAGGVAVVPLIIITMVDYHVTQKAIASEFLLRAARIVSNTRRSIGFLWTNAARLLSLSCVITE